MGVYRISLFSLFQESIKSSGYTAGCKQAHNVDREKTTKVKGTEQEESRRRRERRAAVNLLRRERRAAVRKTEKITGHARRSSIICSAAERMGLFEFERVASKSNYSLMIN